MKRDDDYLRQLLLEIEASAEWFFEGPTDLLNPNPDEAKRGYHLLLLLDGGFVTPIGTDGRYWRMTGAAHDLLANTRESETWAAVKTASAKIGGGSVAILGKVAEAMVMQKLREIGVPV